MAIGPRKSDAPRIRTALRVFKVSAMVTGIFLLLLVVMMITRYGFGLDIEFGGANGPIGLNNPEAMTGINGSTIILIVHGWLYVVYLACDFVLWRLLRWSFGRFLLVALGGVVPFLSFYFELWVPRLVNRQLAELEAEPAVTA